MEKPFVATICGSTRHPDLWRAMEKHLALSGVAAFTVGLFGHGEGIDMAGDIKKGLDRLHFGKILLSDAAIILNKGGYIGLSAMDEMLYALSLGKGVFFIEPIPSDCASALKKLAHEGEGMAFFQKGEGVLGIAPDCSRMGGFARIASSFRFFETSPKNSEPVWAPEHWAAENPN